MGGKKYLLLRIKRLFCLFFTLVIFRTNKFIPAFRQKMDFFQ